MKTYEVLEKALALIEDEKDWCSGGSIGWIGPTFCAEGALGRVVLGRNMTWDDIATVRETGAWEALKDCIPSSEWVWRFNDTHSHGEVVALFQKAIQKEKAEVPAHV